VATGRFSARHEPRCRRARADLTGLADDPLTTAATDLPDLSVLLTVPDGRPTHRDASL
jgi:hypothetical protein